MSLTKAITNKRTIISFIVAFVIFYMLFLQLDINKVISIIKSVNILLYLFAFFVYYISFPIRGLRWGILLKNIEFKDKFRNILEIFFLSWFVNSLIPAKLGDIYRGYLCRENYKISTSKVVGTIFVERIYDVLVLVILLGLSAALSFKINVPEGIKTAIKLGFGLAFILILGLLFIKYKKKYIYRFLPQKIAEIFLNFEEGASHSIVVGTIPIILFYTVIVWLLECVRLYIVLEAVNVNIPISMVIFIALSSALLTALPLTPSGLGVVEFTIAGILTLVQIPYDVAISVAIIDRFISYWSLIIIGGITYILTDKRGNI